jgi:hypothetical protein
MHIFTRQEATAFIRERAELFDAHPDPFAKTAWHLHFLEHVAKDDWEIFAPEDVRSESVMLLYSAPGKRGARRALNNYYSSLYTPEIGGGNLPALARQLSHCRPLCHTLDLSPLDAEARSTSTLQHALEDHGWYVRRYFAFGNWYLPSMPYADYLAGRESRLRNTLTRKRKSFPGDLQLITSPDEVDAAMDGYESVYQKSWKQPEPYPGFIRGWARICAENGWLRMGVAKVGGVVVAAQIWMVVDQKAYIYKLAYDEAYAKLSAGSLLTAMLMQHVLDTDRVVEVDFLTGDDPYKAAWMTERRERVGLFACNQRTIPGILRGAVERVAEFRRKGIRQLRPQQTGPAQPSVE